MTNIVNDLYEAWESAIDNYRRGPNPQAISTPSDHPNPFGRTATPRSSDLTVVDGGVSLDLCRSARYVLGHSGQWSTDPTEIELDDFLRTVSLLRGIGLHGDDHALQTRFGTGIRPVYGYVPALLIFNAIRDREFLQFTVPYQDFLTAWGDRAQSIREKILVELDFGRIENHPRKQDSRVMRGLITGGILNWG